MNETERDFRGSGDASIRRSHGQVDATLDPLSKLAPFAPSAAEQIEGAKTGIVYLVGAGPGDPDLLTIKAHRLIGAADAIVFDYLVAPSILALARSDVERVFVGKKGGGFCCAQRHIEEILIRLARERKRVVRLKGGDPFVFGRGGEEAEALVSAGIAFEIVPGVTSALAASAYAGIPLTHRSHSSAVVFLTGHEDPNKPDAAIHWEDYGRLGATLCVYMGMKNLETITRRLQAGGLAPETPAAVIQSATTDDHRQIVSTVGKIALESEHAGFGAPAIVVIGEVAALSEKLGWFMARAGAEGSVFHPSHLTSARPVDDGIPVPQ
jgi:uroporphyrinogen III methyltransferase / synthase